MAVLARWRQWARRVKREIHAIYLAARDPRTPWYAKAVAVAVVAYAVSPIDLIPDPIPVLGYLDDLVLLPLGILLVRAAIPAEVLAESRERAASEERPRMPGGRIVAAVIVLVWLATLVGLVWLAIRG